MFSFAESAQQAMCIENSRSVFEKPGISALNVSVEFMRAVYQLATPDTHPR